MNNFQFDRVLRAVFVLVFIAVLASCPVTPEPDTSKPTAEAGEPQADVMRKAMVTLSATGSSGANDTPISYLWAQTGGEPMVDLGAANTETVTFEAPTVTASTTLEFTLTVTGSNGETAKDTVTVTILPPTPLTANAGGNLNVVSEREITLDGSGSTPYSGETISNYQWELVESTPAGTTVTLGAVTDNGMTTFTAPTVTGSDTITLKFRLTVTASNGETANDTVTVTVTPPGKADADGDGLIEIDTIEKLHNMRYNLAGTSYKTSAAPMENTNGCPSSGCFGYELIQNLNFDSDGDGSSWRLDASGSFILDNGDSDTTYFDVDAGGWAPVGHAGAQFTATFEGNGHTISNLAIYRNTTHIGLFGHVGGSARIQNIGLVDNLAAYSGMGGSTIYIGGLVGYHQSSGNIIASHATGTVGGGNGGNNSDSIAGLVGRQDAGNIIASYAASTVNGGGGSNGAIGGLVGWQGAGTTIIASYASGAVNGETGHNDRSGGLVGFQFGGDIVASYATGTVNDGPGNGPAGGLVGLQTAGTITASYATGTIESSDSGDSIGKLLGKRNGGSSSESYGFGSTSRTSNSIGALPEGVSAATELTTANVGSNWNDIANDTLGAWDFGTTSEAPVLNYADYDGSGDDYNCDMFPDPDNPDEDLCGEIIPGQYPGGR